VDATKKKRAYLYQVGLLFIYDQGKEVSRMIVFKRREMALESRE
jgi:hypothetical protein